MGRQRRLEKENKFTLGTERCENIKNLYINRKKLKLLNINHCQDYRTTIAKPASSVLGCHGNEIVLDCFVNFVDLHFL